MKKELSKKHAHNTSLKLSPRKDKPKKKLRK